MSYEQRTPAELRTLALMSGMTDEERVEFMATLRLVYCDGCGAKQPGCGFCQCQNDE
jgi:hypothetical protein